MKRALLMILASFFLAASCAKEDSGYQKQVSSIEKFVSSETTADENVVATWSGDIVRLTYPQKGVETGSEKAGENALVKMTYSGYVFGGSLNAKNIFATNDISVAQSLGFDTSDPSAFEPAVISLADKSVLEGLRKGLVGVCAGEKCTVVFPSRYGMGDRIIGTIPASSALAFEIKVIDIEN